MNTNYTGFWLRFVAAIIDGLILGVVNWVILAPILAAIGFSAAGGFPFSGLTNPDQLDVAALVASLTAMFGVAWLVQKIVDLLYHSLLESSKFQGSFGKVALGIIVTDTNGNKLDFTKALVRNVCKFISSAILLIGYIMAGFTEKKQALHDIIAGTLVVMKPKTPAA
ncbi:MAG: RDD family protein [Bacteroidetes bacterium]|nr:RDD family protein [Bacteroidota bacterium]